MSKPLAVFDIDGTIFRSSLLIEMTNSLIEKRLFSIEARGGFDEAYQNWRKRAHLEAYDEYINSVVNVYLANIRGLSANQVEIVSEDVVEKMHAHTYVYTKELIEKLKDTHFVVAISGSPRELVEKFGNKYHFDLIVAADYEIVDGLYTGRVLTSTHTEKDKIIERLLVEHKTTLKGSVGVGDSKGDIAMLNIVDKPIAFNPDLHLLAEANKKGWEVVVERKNVIYKLEKGKDGYKLAQTD